MSRRAWVPRSSVPYAARGDEVWWAGAWWRVERVGRLLVALRRRP